MSNVKDLKNVGHVVLIGTPFFGHTIPLLDLAKYLSEYHHITFVLSSSKIDALKQRQLVPKSLNDQTRLEFIELFDQNDEDYEVGHSFSTSFVDSIIDRMNQPLKELLLSSSSNSLLTSRSIKHPIDLIIYDILLSIVPEIAHQKHILVHGFIAHNIMFLKRYRDVAMGNIGSSIASTEFAQQVIKSISLMDGLICNSVYEFDKQLLSELYEKSFLDRNLPIRFVAPLVSQSSNEYQDLDTIQHIENWLNIQQDKSNISPFIIYIAFGTLARLENEQLVEIAHALHNYSVIWSLKKPFQSYLPSTFIEDSRHLILNWTPQRFILSHPSIRLFISHGGWSSLLESMSSGKVTLVWPLFADQFINGYRIENELQMGRFIQNSTSGNQQRILSRYEVEQYLKDIIDHENIYFDKAQQVKQMFQNAQQNTSRKSLEDILQIIDNQLFKRINQHDEF